MTCIVAMETPEGVVWMGSDSYMGGDDEKDIMDRPKFFRKGELLIGYSNDFRSSQLLETAPKWRNPGKNEDPWAYIVRVVGESLVKIANSNKIITKDPMAMFLIGFRGKVFQLDGAYIQVLRSRHGYAACGAGSAWALGSLGTVLAIPELRDQPPKEKLEMALKMASRHCSRVSPPFFYDHT